MNLAPFLDLVASLLGMAFLLRAWLYAIRMPPFNPYSQTIFKVTDWAVLPLNKLVPNRRYIDSASVLAAFLTALIVTALIAYLVREALALSVLHIFALSLIEVLLWTQNMVFWLTIAMAILSWVNPQAPAMGLLQALTHPLLQPIRRVIPNLGMLDLSPLVLLLGTQVIQIALNNLKSHILLL